MGVETLPTAAVSVAAKSFNSGIGSTGSGLARIGENSLSFSGSALRTLPDSGGSFMPGFTVEGLKGLSEISFGMPKPSLDTYLPPSAVESSIFTITRPKSLEPLSIDLNPETIATRTSFSSKPVKEALQAEASFPDIGFLSETFSYPKFEMPTFVERDTDEALSEKISTFIRTSEELSAEEQLVWKQKLKTIMEQKASAAETATQAVPATETESVVEAKPLTRTIAKMETPPPNSPTAIIPEESPEKETEKDEEGEWKVYSVDQNWVVARDILKQRLDSVNRAVDESTEKSSPADALRGKIAGLDILNLGQYTKIAKGELIVPQVVAKIDHALGFVDENDIEAISGTAQEIVQRNTPQQKNKLARFVEKIKESKLNRPARLLAILGARYIVLRKSDHRWEATKKLSQKEPIELEKVKNEKTASGKRATPVTGIMDNHSILHVWELRDRIRSG